MPTTDTPTFRILSTGQLLDGFTLEQTREALSKRLKLQPNQLDRLLQGRVLLKDGLTQAQAEQYLKVLRATGLDVLLEPSVQPKVEVSTQPQPEAPPATVEAAPSSAAKNRAPGPGRRDFESIFAEPIPRLPVSSSYKLGLVGVLFLSLLAPLIYLGLMLSVLAGLVWYLNELPAMLATIHSFLGRVVIAVTPPFAAIVFLLFLARPLFISHGQNQDLVLEPRKYRRLYDLVAVMCERMGLPAITEIRVNSEVNASIGPRQGLGSLLKRELVLTLGMPLIAGFNSRQLVGVIGHELGHFAQPIAMFTNHVVNRVNYWMASRAFERDAWDDRLARWHGEAQFWVINLMLWAAQAMIWLVRKLFTGMYHFNLWATRRMSRDMEYDADRYECWIAGSDSFQGTAERLHTLGLGAYKAHQANEKAWGDQQLMEDLPAAIAQLTNELSAEEQDQVLRHMNEQQTNLWDTHPANNDRIRQAQTYQYPGIYRLDLPARELLPHFEQLCKIISLREYALYGIPDPSRYLTANANVLAIGKARDESDEALGRYFNGTYSDRLMWLDLAEAPNEELQTLVDHLRTQLPELRNQTKAYWEQLSRLESMHLGQAYLEAKIGIEAQSFSLPGEDLAQANQTIRAALQDLTTLERALRPTDQLFAQRITLAINAMAEDETNLARKYLKSLRACRQLADCLLTIDLYSHVLHGLLSEDNEDFRRALPPVIEKAAGRCGEAVAQFLQVAKQVPVYLGGTERSLHAFAVEWDVVKAGEEFNTAGLAPLTVLETARQCARLLRYQGYRSMAELARLCDGQEQRMGVRGLKLVEVKAGAVAPLIRTDS